MMPYLSSMEIHGNSYSTKCLLRWDTFKCILFNRLTAWKVILLKVNSSRNHTYERCSLENTYSSNIDEAHAVRYPTSAIKPDKNGKTNDNKSGKSQHAYARKHL